MVSMYIVPSPSFVLYSMLGNLCGETDTGPKMVSSVAETSHHRQPSVSAC